jgi:hypothetical protein
VLEGLKVISDKTLSSWPERQRFRYEVLDLKTVFVMKFGIRDFETFRAYGNPVSVTGKVNKQWIRVGSDPVTRRSCVNTADIFPLQRSPSGTPRFLAKYEHIDCGSGHGVEYVAFQWDAKWPFYYENLEMILRREGVLPRENVDPSIWSFRTTGTTITLPYCWHSAVDSWAAAHMCNVDSYDVSGDQIRFIGTRSNYPDLETVAMVIKHAQSRDSFALRGYCVDPQAVTMVVQLVPASFIFAVDGLETIPTGDGKETVELSTNDSTLTFDLVQVQGRWLLSRFAIVRR